MRYLYCLLLAATLLSNAVVFAFETDQYNLPPQPLADIGDEVSDHIAEEIRLAIADVNRQPAGRRSSDAVARAVYDRLAGDDLMTTKFGKWMASHRFSGQPDRYWTDYSESIYVLNPMNYATISPTVRLYGVEFGIDKLEHLLQQGFQYYEIEQKVLANGSSADAAEKKAVEWGRRTERTYYGLLTSGVYSNADLSANFAGLRFYRNLTRPVKAGADTLEPIVIREGEMWKLNARRVADDLLKPFISEHLNEALNPSAYRLTLVRSVRRAVRRHACAEWRAARPDLTAAVFDATRRSLETWHGEDYGWTEKRRTVSLAETCFQQRSD